MRIRGFRVGCYSKGIGSKKLWAGLEIQWIQWIQWIKYWIHDPSKKVLKQQRCFQLSTPSIKRGFITAADLLPLKHKMVSLHTAVLHSHTVTQLCQKKSLWFLCCSIFASIFLVEIFFTHSCANHFNLSLVSLLLNLCLNIIERNLIDKPARDCHFVFVFVGR